MKFDLALLASGFLVVAASQLGCSSDSETPTPVADSGTGTDTGTDTGTTPPKDSGVDSSADSSAPAPVALNGCKPADYVDLTADSATRTMVWGFGQTPPCMKIAKGQTVTFNGDFVSHPLVEKGGDTPNAFSSVQGSGKSRTVTFPNAGTFGYECATHQSITGAIFVQ